MATTYTTNYHLGKQTDHSDKFDMDVITDNMDIIDTQLKTQSDKIDAASLGIKYKGEVNYYSDLPTSGNKIGDAYTVKYAGTSGTTPDGTEYVWGTVSGTNQWINFSKDSYTKAEVDALLAAKQNTVLGSWTAGTATTHSMPAGTDTVLQALEKIDNNQRLDETNISNKANIVQLSNSSVATDTQNFNISDVPNGLYTIMVMNSVSSSSRYGISIYAMRKRTSDIINFTAIHEENSAKITSLTVTDSVATMVYDTTGYHVVTAIGG